MEIMFVWGKNNVNFWFSYLRQTISILKIQCIHSVQTQGRAHAYILCSHVQILAA